MPASEIQKSRFVTTRWSLVRAAARGTGAEARKALDELCATYWYPLYAFTRRSGHAAEDALDLVQGFFARFLARDDLRALDVEGGRFRSYLLAALRHHVANEHERERALKRGGGATRLSFAFDDAEERYAREPASPRSPERLFERKWAIAVLETAFARLEAEQLARDRDVAFARLRHHLVPGGPEEPLQSAAHDLGLTLNAVRVALHRLRRRYGELVRAEIAATVEGPVDIEDELRRLFDAVGE